MRPCSIVLRAPLLAAALLIAVLAPAAASAQAPAARFAEGNSAMQAAQAIARAHWGVDPCGGEVEIDWVRLGRNVNALSSWAVPAADAYGAPELNRDCRIEFSTAMDFTWPKLCTVLVHEYGHLAGHRHDGEPGRLMSPIYDRPLAACSPAAPRSRTWRAHRAARR